MSEINIPIKKVKQKPKPIPKRNMDALVKALNEIANKELS